MLGAIRSVFRCRCPRCYKGKMFTYPLGPNVKKDLVMNKKCEVCGLDFEQEPGYYYGAMYVSYAFSMIELVITLLMIYWITGEISVITAFIAITAVLLLLSPVNFRWGRAGWLAIFYRIDKHIRNNNKG